MDLSDRRKISWLRAARNLVYVGSLVGLSALLVLQVYKCLRFYLAEPTYFSSHIVPQQEAEFPAMTACPEKPGLKDHVLRLNGISGTEQYTSGKNLTWSSNDSTIDERELFDLITYRPYEIYKLIKIRFLKASQDGKSHVEMRPNNTGGPIIEQRHRKFGKCYTFHPEPWMAKLGIYYIHYEFYVPTKVYFHGKDQYLDLSGRMGYKFYLGESAQAQVHYQDMRLLSKLNKNGSLSCTNDNYDQCMYSSLEKHMVKEHGCVVPFILSKEHVCKRSEAVNGTFWIAYNRVTNQQNDCAVPCKALMISMSGQYAKAVGRDHATAVFYFSQRVALDKERYFYSFMSAVGEIGGYVGLLLGVSLMHGATCLSRFIDGKIAELVKKSREVQHLC